MPIINNRNSLLKTKLSNTILLSIFFFINNEKFKIMTITKAERRKNELERHYAAIKSLLIACNVIYEENMMQRKAINTSSRLLQIERIAHKAATDYCNGDINSEVFDRISEVQTANVQLLFKGNLKGFFINGDARGYALKIKDSVMRDTYKDINLQKDWGGYGLLAPEITGN